MNFLNQYQGILKAVREMGYDNGCINRECPEDQYLAAADAFLVTLEIAPDDAAAWDQWLLTLDEEMLNLLIGGEYSDIRELLKSCPRSELLDYVLDAVFENV